MSVYVPYNFIFILLIVVGTLFCISSSHWIGVWAGLEINLLGFIPLVVYGGSVLEVECGVKYFIIQSMGSGLLLFRGLFNVSSFLSWRNFVVYNYGLEVSNLFLGEGLSFFLLSMVLVRFLIKLGLSPFHFWLPSVISGLSWIAALFLVTWQKVAPLFLVIIIVGKYSFVLLLCCVISSLVGGIGGLNQTQLRTLLAYSSINHLGWLVASGICRIVVMVIYFIIYFIVSFILFYFLWLKEKNQIRQLRTMELELRGGKLLFSILILSLGGFPPLLGFIGKWLVITELFIVEPVVLFFLLVGSLISLFYYLSLFFRFFFTLGIYHSLVVKKWYVKENTLFIMLSVIVNLRGMLAIIWFPVYFYGID